MYVSAIGGVGAADDTVASEQAGTSSVTVYYGEAFEFASAPESAQPAGGALDGTRAARIGKPDLYAVRPRREQPVRHSG